VYPPGKAGGEREHDMKAKKLKDLIAAWILETKKT
jgi:hypothetical protein